MKQKPIFKITFPALRLALCMGMCLFALVSCSQDDGVGTPPAEEDVYINLHINVPGSISANGRALSSADETTVNNLQVLVFNAADLFQYKAEISVPAGLATSDGGVYVRLKRSTMGETYYLVMLANTGELTPTGNPGKRAVLERYAFSTTTGGGGSLISGFPNSGGTSVPMWGESIPQVINSKTAFGTISLHRAVARVDVGVNIKNDEASSSDDNPVAEGLKYFRLTDVRVYNSLDMGYVASTEGFGTVSVPAGAKVYSPNCWVDYNTVKDYKLTHHDIYIAEVMNHTADTDGAFTLNKELKNRCCLVVGGKYVDKNTADGELNTALNNAAITYYRIDFLRESGNDATLQDIERNHRYIFNITGVHGLGYTSPEDAFENKPMNISVNEVGGWDDGSMNGDYVVEVE